MTDPPKVLRLLLLGSESVGKTSLFERWLNHSFPESVGPTIGCTVTAPREVFDIEGHECSVHFHDNSGAELDACGVNMPSCDNLSAMIVYDVTDSSSFDAVPQWIATLTEISKSVLVPFVLIGNKSDLDGKFDQTRVTQFVNEYENLSHFETSAKMGDKVEEAFTRVLHLALHPASIEKKKPKDSNKKDDTEDDNTTKKKSRCCLLL
jgi:small GTP-binding protein